MATTIYKQYLDDAIKKAKNTAANAVSKVTLPQGNPPLSAVQGAAQGASPANNSSLQSALQKGVSAAQQMAAAALPGAATNNGAVATNSGSMSSTSATQSALQSYLKQGTNAAKTYLDAALPTSTPEQAALQQALEKARSLHAAYAPTSTQGGRTADGKYRLGDGSTYDTLQDAVNANAGANDYEITEENGETLYDGKPLYNGTGVLAAKGDGGKITSSPSGTYVHDAAGNMIRPDYLGKDVETGGHTNHGLFSSSNGYIYDFDTATDEELMNHGYYRAPDGSVRIAEDQDQILYRLKNGMDPSQAASQMVQNQLRSGTLNVPGTGPVDVSPYYPQSGGKQSGQGGSKPSGQSWQDVEIPQKPGYDYTYKDANGVTHYVLEPRSYTNTRDPGTPGPTPSGSQPQTQPQTQPQKTPEQAYLDQYDYGKAPEWTGTDYETQRDAALAAAQGMQWDGSEYQTLRDQAVQASLKPWTGSDYDTQRDEALKRAQSMQWNGSDYDTQRDEALRRAQGMPWNGSEYQDQRDQLLADAMKPYEGSPYDEKRNAAIEAAAEKWQGSEYQTKRDEALQRAENMQWNYDPNTDPVWQALQKQYRREGDRATKEALGQAAAMTGGVPSSYAVTAANQAGNYYASQLSDRLPQVYQDAYNRYLQEFQRQMGISDQYAGFDDREYARWADQQGRNLDLADRYNQYGQQDYGMYQDRVNQQLAGADRYSDYDRTAYQQFMDQYGRELDSADRLNQYGQQAYSQFMDRYGQELDTADRLNNYGVEEYGRFRDEASQQLAAADRYSDYDQNEYQRYLDQYGQQLDAADRLNQYGATEYGRYQDRLGQFNTDRNFQYGLNRDAVEDARYEDERDYNRAWNEDERAYSRAWNEDERNYKRWMDQLDLDYRERQFAQQLKEYADAQGWKSAEWQQYLREYEDQLSDKERQWVYQMARDAESDRRYNQEFRYQMQQDALDNQYRQDEFNYQKERDTVGDAQYRDEMEYKKQRDAKNDAYYEDETTYRHQQDDLDRQYTEDQDTYKKYLDDYEQQQMDKETYNRDYDDAMAFMYTYGVVDGRYADILDVPPGTTWDEYLARYGGNAAGGGNEVPQSGGYSGGYTGGGYTGGGYTGGGSEPKTEGDDLPKGQYREGGYTYVKGKTHPQGQPMTAMYEQAYNDTYDKWMAGTDYGLLLSEVSELVTSRRITDYEGQMILRDLKRWEETKSNKKASGSGGGGGIKRTQMTK